MVRFRIAVPQWRRTDSGDYEDLEPRWYTVRAWDRLAQNITTSLSKGQPVIVVGRPVSNAWVDSNGQIHSEIVINATAVGHDLSQGSAMFFKRGQAPNTNGNTPQENGSSSTDEVNASSSSGETGDGEAGEETPVNRTHIGEHRSDVEDDDFLTNSDQRGTDDNNEAVETGSGELAELMSGQAVESVFAHAYSAGGAA